MQLLLLALRWHGVFRFRFDVVLLILMFMCRREVRGTSCTGEGAEGLLFLSAHNHNGL